MTPAQPDNTFALAVVLGLAVGFIVGMLLSLALVLQVQP